MDVEKDKEGLSWIPSYPHRACLRACLEDVKLIM